MRTNLTFQIYFHTLREEIVKTMPTVIDVAREKQPDTLDLKKIEVQTD
jgi:hypothetical protein